MGEPTKEQIERLRKLGSDRILHAGWVGDLHTLLDAYEERGRELERLKSSAPEIVSALGEERTARKQAEAEVARLRADRDSLRQDRDLFSENLGKTQARLAEVVRYMQDHNFKPGRDWACAQCGDNPIVQRGFVCAWHEALAAAQPEEENRATVPPQRWGK